MGRVDTPYRVSALPSLLKCNCEIVVVACQHLIKSSRHTEGCPRHLRQRSDSFSLSLSPFIFLSLPIPLLLCCLSRSAWVSCQNNAIWAAFLGLPKPARGTRFRLRLRLDSALIAHKWLQPVLPPTIHVPPPLPLCWYCYCDSNNPHGKCNLNKALRHWKISNWKWKATSKGSLLSPNPHSPLFMFLFIMMMKLLMMLLHTWWRATSVYQSKLLAMFMH